MFSVEIGRCFLENYSCFISAAGFGIDELSAESCRTVEQSNRESVES